MNKKQMVEMSVMIVGFALVFTLVAGEFNVYDVQTEDWIMDSEWNVGDITIVTENMTGDDFYEPDIWGGNMSFAGYNYSNLYDTQIYINETGVYNLSVEGWKYGTAIYEDKIVWCQMNNTDYSTSLRMKDLSTNNTYILENSAIYGIYYPRIWEDYVTYTMANSGGTDIYLYHDSINEQLTTSGNGYQSDIYGDIVVWSEWDSGDSIYQIHTFNITTSEEEIIADDGTNPRIWGDYVVFEDGTTGDSRISIYDLETATKTSLMQDAPYYIQGMKPTIYEETVVFFTQQNGTIEVAIIMLNDFGNQYFTLTETNESWAWNKYCLEVYGDTIIWDEENIDDGNMWEIKTISISEIEIEEGEEGQDITMQSGYDLDWIYFTSIIAITLLGLIVYYVSEFKVDDGYDYYE